MQPILELRDISYAYHTPEGETYALSDISLQLNDGEFVAIVGPSGCGKSTLLSLVSGLLTPESGSILFRGQSSGNANTKIGYMLQKDHLFEWRSIYRNILLGLEIRKNVTPETKKRAQELLNTYGLWPFRDARPSQLSGGMRQRAALIRTLVLEPDLMLLDEPFSALDYQTRLSVCDDIASIIKKEHKTALLVTHDLSEAISVADRVVILTPRPGTIKSIVPIKLDMPDRTPMKSRNAPEFKDYFNLIWKELNSNE